MLISATGSDSRDRAGQQGFTLVEVMLVLFLIGLAARAVAVALPGDEAALRDEAQAFAARLNAVRTAAVLQNRDYSVAVSMVGYSAERYRGGEWLPAAKAERFGGTWKEGTDIMLGSAPYNADGSVRIDFSPIGGSAPAHFVLLRGGARMAIHVSDAGAARVVRDD